MPSPSMAISCRFVQPEKASFPTLVALLGMFIFVRDVHSEKAFSSTIFTTDPSAKTMLSKLVQREKASRPTLVTLVGISTFVKDVQPLKAFSSMVFTMDPSAKTMLSKLVQREKASRPTLVMLAGISTFVRDVQPLKAFSPMVSMVSASFTSFKFVRPENASFSTFVTPSFSLTVFKDVILANTCF